MWDRANLPVPDCSWGRGSHCLSVGCCILGTPLPVGSVLSPLPSLLHQYFRFNDSHAAGCEVQQWAGLQEVGCHLWVPQAPRTLAWGK